MWILLVIYDISLAWRFLIIFYILLLGSCCQKKIFHIHNKFSLNLQNYINRQNGDFMVTEVLLPCLLISFNHIFILVWFATLEGFIKIPSKVSKKKWPSLTKEKLGNVIDSKCLSWENFLNRVDIPFAKVTNGMRWDFLLRRQDSTQNWTKGVR